MIAGHEFLDGRCSCGLAWVDIRNVTSLDVDKEGIAHTGRLLLREYEEILAVRVREDDRIADAMTAVAAGAGR